MYINLNNIEELLFYDKKVHRLLPEFKHHFDKWILSKTLTGMRQMTKSAVLELLNSIEDEHVKLLESHFGTRVTIDKLNHHLIKDVKLSLNEIDGIEGMEEFPNFCVYRDGDHLYVCGWR